MGRIELLGMPTFRKEGETFENLKEIRAQAFLWETKENSSRRKGWSAWPNDAEKGGSLGMESVHLNWSRGGCW